MDNISELKDLIDKLAAKAQGSALSVNPHQLFSLSEENLSKLIKEKKQSLGLTQQMVSDLSGVAKGTVQKIEKGDQQVTLQSFTKVLSVLGIELCLRQK